MEEEQQFVGFRQHGFVQREQQHDEPGGAERRAHGVARAESDVEFAGRSSEASQAEEPGRTRENERCMVRLVPLHNGTGNTGVRHPQAKIQVLLVLRFESEDRRREDKHDLRTGQVAIARRRDRLHRGRDAHVRCSSGSIIFLLSQ